MTPAEVARFMGSYAKHFAAGAFATPTRKELEADPSVIHEWPGFVAVSKVFSKPSVRKDFTGEGYALDGHVATHVAWDRTGPVPLLSVIYDYVMAYLDDNELCRALREQGFVMAAAKVTSSSELIGVFCSADDLVVKPYEPHDLATVTALPLVVPEQAKKEMLDEIHGLTGFRDDWPLYSDGTWGALCLKGFYPEDPGKDMKPTEMPRAWREEHTTDLGRICEWTSLAADCPAIVDWVTSVPGWESFERVRLLQMSGNNGKGGSLGRHTDIGDKAGGTRDGQIVRFHMPLITHPDIKLHAWDLSGEKTSTHLEPWTTYYLDARKPHAVSNPTGVDRIHLVADVVCTPAVREQIGQAYLLG